jgi:glycosyltransferase involved in cell wall biosynthesis
MKIGVDLRPLSLGQSGGILQLVQGVFESVFDRYPEHQFLVFCTPFNRSLLERDAEHVCYFSLPIANYFQELDRIALQEDLQILFRSYPVEDTLRFPMHKQIVLIPDNQHEVFPEFFSPEVLDARRRAFSRALEGAGAVGTISEFSRKSLVDFPGTCCEDVFLMEPSLQVVHGLGKGEQKLAESERTLIPREDYFLFPANLWKHKNHLRLLQAFRLLRERTGREISLILTGHSAGWSELSTEFSDLPVTHLGFVRPELLRVLLERARALVFFSLYEGFGIPLLEAFDAGTPVVCSNMTSLPEVGGDAVLTCDPTDVEAMAALMERILNDEALRATLVKRGKSRLRFYSWEKSAHSLVRACERVAARYGGLTETRSASGNAIPLVSIVTPSYNQGRFLKRTIESVLAQTYPNIEYLVIDGGSIDESIEILRSYENRFHWISEPDHGQTDAINKGMARAKGEILTYLNSDDILFPHAIERVVQYFRQHPSCDMVYGDADYIDEEDSVLGSYRTADYSFNRLLEDCMVCQPAAFWRRRIAEKVGPFDERLNFAMDYDYWLRIAKADGEIRFLPEKLACSRLYPETKTRSARSRIYKEIFEICRKNVGRVHESYYQGYWHHLIHEKNNLASRVLRRYHGSHTKFAWLHHKWSHRDRYSVAQVASFIVKKVSGHVAAAMRRAKGSIKRRSPVATPLRRDAPVQGFWPDNWLEPKLTITPKARVLGQALHIAGVAPIDQTMTVAVGEKEICQCDFKARQYKKITFPADLVDGEKINIRFSAFVEDPTKRKLAFLLQDTNVFSEQDTY